MTKARQFHKVAINGRTMWDCAMLGIVRQGMPVCGTYAELTAELTGGGTKRGEHMEAGNGNGQGMGINGGAKR